MDAGRGAWSWLAHRLVATGAPRPPPPPFPFLLVESRQLSRWRQKPGSAADAAKADDHRRYRANKERKGWPTTIAFVANVLVFLTTPMCWHPMLAPGVGQSLRRVSDSVFSFRYGCKSRRVDYAPAPLARLESTPTNEWMLNIFWHWDGSRLTVGPLGKRGSALRIGARGRTMDNGPEAAGCATS
ncbi:unnamed protein product, partial [Iphiclides podalirius]